MRKYVLISDIHYNLQNLELSDYSLDKALRYAEQYNIKDVIIAGDLHDTKALWRSECMTRLIKTLQRRKNIDIYVLIGNHDRLNEKSPEHSLEFLRPYVTQIIDTPRYIEKLHLNFIPYCETREKFLEALKTTAVVGYPIIAHQGFIEADMGHYMKDHSAVSIKDVSAYTIISGHYHKQQTIGSVTYIGNPFTMSFADSNEYFKGFLILDEQGNTQIYPLGRRCHRKLEVDYNDRYSSNNISNKFDIVSLTINCTVEQAAQIQNEMMELRKFIKADNLSINLVYTNDKETDVTPIKTSLESELDNIINDLTQSTNDRIKIKELWRSL